MNELDTYQAEIASAMARLLEASDLLSRAYTCKTSFEFWSNLTAATSAMTELQHELIELRSRFKRRFDV